MSRFSNLEFEEEPRSAARAEGAMETRDDRYYMRSADESFLRARFDEALRYYSRALEFDPNLDQAWVGQVRMLIELGELREAGIWAEKALEIFRDHAELLAARAVVCLRRGEGERALEFSDASLKQKGARPYVWLARGETLLARRQANEDACFAKAILAADGGWIWMMLVARLYHHYRRPSIGLGHARRALELKPDSAFVWFVLGSCQLDLDMVADARKAFGEAVSLDRDFRPARDALLALDNRKLSNRLGAALRGLFRARASS